MLEPIKTILVGSVAVSLLIATIYYFHKIVLILGLVLCGLSFAYLIGDIIRSIFKDWEKKHEKESD